MSKANAGQEGRGLVLHEMRVKLIMAPEQTWQGGI